MYVNHQRSFIKARNYQSLSKHFQRFNCNQIQSHALVKRIRNSGEISNGSFYPSVKMMRMGDHHFFAFNRLFSSSIKKMKIYKNNDNLFRISDASSSKPKSPALVTDSLQNFTLSCFIFLVCPFRLVSSKDKISVVSTWLPQMILCGIVTLSGFLWILRDLRSSIPKNWQNPSVYFVLLETVAINIQNMIFERMMWLQKENFAYIANLFSTYFNDTVMRYPGISRVRWVGKIVWVVYMCVGAYQFTFGTNGLSRFLPKEDNITSTEYYQRGWAAACQWGWYNIFLPKKVSFGDLSFFDHLLGTATIIGLYHK